MRSKLQEAPFIPAITCQGSVDTVLSVVKKDRHDALLLPTYIQRKKQIFPKKKYRTRFKTSES